MATIQFYHLTATPLGRALPKLMEKALAGGFRALVVTQPEHVEQVDDLLWTYDPASFLPHGSEKAGRLEAQPILISAQAENRNGATLLVITDGRSESTPDNWARILDIFDGKDAEAVAAARQRWTAYKEQGHELSYLKQTENGGWQQPPKE